VYLREQAFPGFLKVPLSVMTFLGLKTHMVTVNGSVSNKHKKDFRSFAMMMKALHQVAKNHTKRKNGEKNKEKRQKKISKSQEKPEKKKKHISTTIVWGKKKKTIKYKGIFNWFGNL
jgi:transposase